MINRFFVLLLLFITVSINKSICQFSFKTYAIDNVHVIDVNNKRVNENQTIIIEDGLIIGIINADEYDENDTIQSLDYSGYYITPGLIDAHVHVGTNPSGSDNLEATKERLHYLLKNGITTVRDMAGDARYLSYLARQASLDEIPSPDIHYSALLAGETFFKDPRTKAAAQGMPEGGAPWMRGVNENSDLNLIIAEAKGTGATGIKIYADLNFESVQKIVLTAHAQKMKVWAHSCVFPARPSEVCQAGVDVMSHATYMAWEGEGEIPPNATNRHRKHDNFNLQNPVFSILIELMAEKQTILDATLGVYKRYFPDSTLYQYGVSITKLAYEHQVKIGIGTDLSLNDLNVPAPIFTEMSSFQRDVGMEPIEIIRAATLINAEMIGQEHRIGSVELGKRANLLIFKENPVEDIEILKHPKVVIKNGKMFNGQ